MKTCKHCGGQITGPGANNAVLCLDCWAELLIRVEGGTPQLELAREYGVANQTVSRKVAMYGDQP